MSVTRKRFALRWGAIKGFDVIRMEEYGDKRIKGVEPRNS